MAVAHTGGRLYQDIAAARRRRELSHFTISHANVKRGSLSLAV
jgi:hypothetical protein